MHKHTISFLITNYTTSYWLFAPFQFIVSLHLNKACTPCSFPSLLFHFPSQSLTILFSDVRVHFQTPGSCYTHTPPIHITSYRTEAMKWMFFNSQHNTNDLMVTEGPEETKNSELCTTRVKINIILHPSFHARANWKSSLLSFSTLIAGDRGSTVVKVLYYKSEGRWFDPIWCQWIFHWHKILPDHTMALGSTQPLTEMSTRSIPWG